MMNPGKKFMKKRIEFIAREQKYSLFLLAVMMIIMFMAIACTYTGTVHMEAKMKVEYFGIANEAGG